jgi:hypothetical protein
MYRIREDIDINTLIDGRTFFYLSNVLSFNRENLAKILKGQRTCTYDRAKQIVDYCRPNDTVEKYFKYIESEG